MDEPRARIHDDLRGLLEGELLFEPIARAPYAHDAGLHEVDPLGIVAPRTEDDLIALVQYAAENRLPLHARGGGTGRAGGCLGPGLVVDFARHLRRVVEIGPESVVVQAGVVLDVLNARLAPLGRRLGIDPEGGAAATIGGLVGIDAAGARWRKYGSMADHVEALRVVFANGEADDLGRIPWPAADAEPTTTREVIARRLATLLNWHADLIGRCRPRGLRNRGGYALASVAVPGGLDLARLVVGSAGTLALVTSATLRTVPIAPAQGVVLLPFRRLVGATSAVAACLEADPSAIELYDWRTLSLVREAGPPEFRGWIAEAAEAVLVVEFEGDDPSAVGRRVRALAGRLDRLGDLAAPPVEVHRRADGERLVNLRRAVAPLLMRRSGPSWPVPLVEDVAVPPQALPALLGRLQAIFKARGVNATIDAHAGHGEVHIAPFLDLADPADLARLEPLVSEIAEAALDLGGTVAGEFPTAPDRPAASRLPYSELRSVCREVKNAFDPQDLLNPGQVVGDDPGSLTARLQARLTTATPLPVLSEPLRWPGRDRTEHVTACNGCGACRSEEPTLRMCPIFRASHAEEATPRSKVNLLRQVAAGVLDPKTWGSDELKANADLCVHCNLCRSECPSGIDVSNLMIEAKAAFVENHGLPPDDWVLSRIDRWSALASRFPILFNVLMGNRLARRFLERAFGLSRHRTLPRAHRTSFLQRAERLGLTRPRPREPGPRAAYFIDTAADHFDQELAEATVAVLHHAGVNVYVPKGQRGSGMPALVAGDLDRARELLLANLRVLGNAVRDGYTIVCTEPTAALMLRHEALRLVDDLDAALVAEVTMDVGQYLAGLAARGQWPRPMQPLHARVGYHQPCHLRALGVGTPGLDLIRTIPGLDVEFIDRGCSGIAGTFGLTARNFRTSLRAGRGLRDRLRDADLQFGATECSACRMQMEQGIAKRTFHPIKLLALGHGLNPNLRQALKSPRPGVPV